MNNLTIKEHPYDPNYYVIFSSSGGSGHLRAAKTLRESIEANGGKATEYNVMHHLTYSKEFGDECVRQWNDAQQCGDVKKQVKLLDRRHYFDWFAHIPARLNASNIFLNKGPFPNRVIATSPMLIAQIIDAVIHANHVRKKSGEQIISVDIHCTEPPTKGAFHFFDPIRNLNKHQRKYVRLFTLPPSEKSVEKMGGEEAFWEDLANLPLDQIIYDPPITSNLKASENMPAPNQAMTVTLKGQTTEESDFLASLGFEETEEETFSLNIKAEDKVGLIMLGGVPTEDAIKKYLDSAIAAAAQNSEHIRNEEETSSHGKNYLFIACGKHELGIYDKAVKRVRAVGLNDQLTIIPFTGQDCASIFARSNISITRSGGMTSCEVYALKGNPKRHDPKVALIHAEIPEPKLASNYLAHRALALDLVFQGKCAKRDFFDLSAETQDNLLKEAYENYLREKGIPLWEGSNAEYLRDTFPETTGIVRPDMVLAAHFERVFFNNGDPKMLFTVDNEYLKDDLEIVTKAYKKEIFKEKCKRIGLIALGSIAMVAAVAIAASAAFSVIYLGLFIIVPLAGCLALGGIATTILGSRIDFRKNAQNHLFEKDISLIK